MCKVRKKRSKGSNTFGGTKPSGPEPLQDFFQFTSRVLTFKERRRRRGGLQGGGGGGGAERAGPGGP